MKAYSLPRRGVWGRNQATWGLIPLGGGVLCPIALMVSAQEEGGDLQIRQTPALLGEALRNNNACGDPNCCGPYMEWMELKLHPLHDTVEPAWLYEYS